MSEMITFEKAVDAKKAVWDIQTVMVKDAITEGKRAGRPDSIIPCAVLPEIVAALVCAGYDVFIVQQDDGTSLTLISWVTAVENTDGEYMVSSDLDEDFEDFLLSQIQEAVEARPDSHEEDPSD